jgi:hypothetical protein
MGQDVSEHETKESENYPRQKKVMRGHAEDSRFDEGSTKHEGKIVRPDCKGYDKGRFFQYLGK